MQLYRVIIPVVVLETAVNFYSLVFDQQGIRVSEGRHYFNLDGVIIALYNPIDDGDLIKTQWSFNENQYLYFAVNDIELIYERLRKMNRLKKDEVITLMPWGERLFYATDPFGYPLCFVDKTALFLG